MKIRTTILALCSFIFGATSLLAKEKAKNSAYGFVNFETCMTSSLRGKKEKDLLEKQFLEMEKLVKDLETQANEDHKKLNDQDYLDAITPQAQEELQVSYQRKMEELRRAHLQYSHARQQIQNRFYQILSTDVKRASEIIAKAKNFDAILHSEATFFSSSDFDVTEQVIAEMDRLFNEENKKL